MTEPYILWALLAGFAIGGAVVWFAIGRIPRRSDDVGPAERVEEATWIRSTLAGRGRRVPDDLVEEVLELHDDYVGRT